MEQQELEQKRFHEICQQVIHDKITREGIGTLGEKTLHAVLKKYFEPMEEYHEIKVGRYVADILHGADIIEVQTKQFNKLRSKLKAFLPQYDVTVVHPILVRKWIYWIEPETGEISGGRRSPRKRSKYDIFVELYKIKEALSNPNFHLCLVLLEAEEYRMLNGWSKDKKKGSVCSDRLPKELIDLIYVNDREDYQQFLPQGLEAGYSSKEFAKAAGISVSLAQVTLNVLYELKVVKRIGKKGNAFLYKSAMTR